MMKVPLLLGLTAPVKTSEPPTRLGFISASPVTVNRGSLNDEMAAPVPARYEMLAAIPDCPIMGCGNRPPVVVMRAPTTVAFPTYCRPLDSDERNPSSPILDKGGTAGLPLSDSVEPSRTGTRRGVL